MYLAIPKKSDILSFKRQKELIRMKDLMIELSIEILIQLKTFIYQFILSYEEYSLVNIREHGLGEILMRRSLRFFKLGNDEGEEEEEVSQSESKVKKTKKKKMSFFQKAVRIVLYPIYIFILIIEKLVKPYSKKPHKPKSKRNHYIPK